MLYKIKTYSYIIVEAVFDLTNRLRPLTIVSLCVRMLCVSHFLREFLNRESFPPFALIVKEQD